MDLSFEFTSVVMLTLIFWPHFLSKAEQSNPIIMRMIKPLRLFYLYIKLKENGVLGFKGLRNLEKNNI